MTDRKIEKSATRQQNKKFPRNAILLELTDGDSEETKARKMTAALTATETAAMRVMQGAESKTGNWENIDVPTLIEQLQCQAAAVNRGDLSQAEAMLMNQATALQSLFSRLAERGMSCDHVAGFEANMRMALRAQSQCRATLETLAEIKNPHPVAFVKQANIAAGPQQVNNGIAPEASRAREIENQPSKLLEADNGKWMDTGTASATSGTDKAMATLGEVDRAKNG